jgi:hypothetical protein
METTYAYLAGIIDIDGYISIKRDVKFRQRLQSTVAGYRARVGLSDASPVVPDILNATFPGRRSFMVGLHLWEAEQERAREPLTRFLPYLRLKRRQAEIALELLNLLGGQTAGLTRLVSEQETKQYLYEEITRLNKPSRRRKDRLGR